MNLILTSSLCPEIPLGVSVRKLLKNVSICTATLTPIGLDKTHPK